MAVVSLVRNHSFAGVKAAGTTQALTLDAAGVAAGNLLVAFVLFDNAATASKPVVSSLSKAAGETNSWVFIGASRSTSTSAGAFASGEIWAINTTVAWPGSTVVTVTLDTSVTMKALSIVEWAGTLTALRGTVGTAYSATTTPASAATTGTTPVTGDVAIGFTFQSNSTSGPAYDADTTGGNWLGVGTFGTTGGSGASNNYGTIQWKKLSSGAAQTLNSATATAGNGSIVAIFQQYVDPSITQASYRFYADGTEGGALVSHYFPTGTTNLFSGQSKVGESFIGDGFPLKSVKFNLWKLGSPDGNITVELYAHAGTYGSSGLPSGSPLATSVTTVLASSLDVAAIWFTFDFDGTFTLESGTPYFIVVASTNTQNASNYVAVVQQNSSDTHLGNRALYTGGWAATTGDLCLYLYTDRALAAQDTPYTANVDAGDVNLQVRTRLQNTSALAGDPWDKYQLQWEKNASGIYEPATSLIGGYTYAPSYTMTASASDDQLLSQVLGDGRKLSKVRFQMRRTTDWVGDVTAIVYASTLGFGVSGALPTGSVLAQSVTLTQTALTTNDQVVDFDFDGTYTLQSGITYFVGFLSNNNSSGYLVTSRETASGGYAGRSARWVGSWANDVVASWFEVVPLNPGVVEYHSANLTDAAATTNRLTGGTGTFIAGKVSEDGLVDNLALTANNYTELLYSLTLKKADLSNSDTLRFRVLRNGATTGLTYTQTPTISITKTPVAITQAAYRFYSAGTESGSTALAAQDSAPSVEVSSGSTQIQLRARLQSTTTVAPDATDDWVLQYEQNLSGTWNTINPITVPVAGMAAGLTDFAATTNRLSAGTGSFVSGKVSTSGIVQNFTWSATDYTEMVFGLGLEPNSLSDGDTLRFRILRNGATTSLTYTQIPTITVTKAPVAITQAAYRFYADGTETGSTALAAQDTVPAVDVSSGDVNLQLRTRLQSTTVASIAFADDFQLQYEKNASGSWGIVVPTGETLEDSFPDTGFNTFSSVTQIGMYAGQSFMGYGRSLSKVGFFMRKVGSPPGLMKATVYAHSGTYGSGGVGTGAPLTSSTPVAAAECSTAWGWYYFIFDESLVLSLGIPYVVVVEVDTATDASNAVQLGTFSTGTHSGNSVYYSGGSWSTPSGQDRAFQVYGNVHISIPYNSSNLTDGAVTTNRLTGGTGTFTAGEISETGLVTNLGWSGNNYTELLYSLTLKQADLTNGDTLRFRVLRNGVTTGFTYTQVPTLTIGAVVAGPTVSPTGIATAGVVGAPVLTASAATVAVAGIVTKEALGTPARVLPMSSFFDDFSGNLSKWPDGYGVDVAGGKARIDLQSNGPYFATTESYGFVNSQIFFRVEYPAPLVDGDLNAQLQFLNGYTTIGLRYFAGDDTARMLTVASYTPGEGYASVDLAPYDPVAHAWWKMSTSGSTISFQTSPDGMVWTERGSRSLPSLNLTSGARMSFSCAGQAPSPSYAYVDNVNVPVLNPQPSGISSQEACGIPTVSTPAPIVQASGVFGVTLGSGYPGTFPFPHLPELVGSRADGILSGEALGTPAVAAGAATLSPTGIAGQGAVGTPVATVGAATVAVAGIVSAERFVGTMSRWWGNGVADGQQISTSLAGTGDTTFSTVIRPENTVTTGSDIRFTYLTAMTYAAFTTTPADSLLFRFDLTIGSNPTTTQVCVLLDPDNATFINRLAVLPNPLKLRVQYADGTGSVGESTWAFTAGVRYTLQVRFVKGATTNAWRVNAYVTGTGAFLGTLDVPAAPQVSGTNQIGRIRFGSYFSATAGQEVTLGDFAWAPTVGTDVNEEISWTGVRSSVTVTPGGIAGGGSVGTPTATTGPATVNLVGQGITTPSAIGVPVAGSVTTVSPAGIGTGVAVGTPTFSAGAQNVVPAGGDTAEAFGTFVAVAGPAAVTAVGAIPSTEASGTGVATAGLTSVVVTGIGTAAAVGTASATAGAATAGISGIASAEIVGTPTAAIGSVTAVVTGIGTAVATGTPAVTTGAATVTTAGVATAGAVGTPVATTGTTTVVVAGIASAELFGTTAVIGASIATPGGIGSAGATGTPAVTTGVAAVTTTGIVTAEAVGTSIVTTGPATATVSGVATAEVLGTSVVVAGVATVTAGGILTAEVAGTPAASGGVATSGVTGIVAAGAVGTPAVVAGATLLGTDGIPTAGAVGTPAVTTGSTTAVAIGIASPDAVGTPVATGGGATSAVSGIPTAGAVGTPAMTSVFVTGIPTAEAFGAVTAMPAIGPVGITTQEDLGVSVFLTAGAVSPTDIPSDELFGTSGFLGGPIGVTAVGGIGTAGASGTATALAGPVVLTAAGVATSGAAGTATVSTGPATVAMTGIVDLVEAVGTATVTTGPAMATAGGIVTSEAAGSATVSTGRATVADVGGTDTSEAAGTATVSTGQATAVVDGIASAEASGAATVSTGQGAVTAAGIASAGASGTATVQAGPAGIVVDGIGPAEISGTGATVSGGPATVTAAGIASAETFGTTNVIGANFVTLGAGIASLEASGTGSVSVGRATVADVGGITTSELSGTATVVPGRATATVAGIAPAEAIGTADVIGANFVTVAGIGSTETSGAAEVSAGRATVTVDGTGTSGTVPSPAVSSLVVAVPTGIDTQEAFGSLAITEFLEITPPDATLGALGYSFGGSYLGIFPNQPESLPSQRVVPPSVEVTEGCGTPAVSATITATAASVPGGELLGVPDVSGTGVALVAAQGIPGGESFGATTLLAAITGAAQGIPSGEALGTPAVGAATSVTPIDIPSQEIVPAPYLGGGPITFVVAGIGGAAAVGAPGVWPGATLLQVVGMDGEEAFGTLSVTKRLYASAGILVCDIISV